MMENLQIFKNAEFGEIRTIEENGKVLFCGSDVAKSLKYVRPNDALRQHCRYTVKRSIPHPQSKTKTIEMLFIPEGDIYRLVSHSELPSAERFESWVFDEVLPSIRKNGGYIAGQESLTDDELMAKALLVAQNKIAERDKRIEQLLSDNEEMKPKALFADAVSASKTSILIGELAKILKQNGVDIGQNRLFAWMRYNGYLIESGERYNQPTQYSMERGLFELKERVVTNPDGSVRMTITTKVTGKGQQYFINYFLQNVA